MDARTTFMLAVGMVILLLLGFCAAPKLGSTVGALHRAPAGSSLAETYLPPVPGPEATALDLERSLETAGLRPTGARLPD